MLVDSCARKIEYLRLSLTDLCNIRCEYCMPIEGIFRIPKTEVMTLEEMIRMVTILASLGIKRVRLTGGEPLLRKDLALLIHSLKNISDIEEVLLTTNGILLEDQAMALKEAGLDRINIHLDTLLSERFRRITRLGAIERVFSGIEAAQKAGFSPIKINTVIQRGINDDEVESLLKFCSERNLVLRLIEMMPIGPGRDIFDRYVSLSEIREQLSHKYHLTPYVESDSQPDSHSQLPVWGKGPARYEWITELKTPIGFIRPISEPFCDSCNRIRISSDGRFQDCLAYDGKFSFRDLMRNPLCSDEEIESEVRLALQGKRIGHEGFEQEDFLRTPCMSGIGG